MTVLSQFNYSHHHHHISFMELGHLLTRSGLTYPEVSSKVYHDSFCRLGSSISLPWVIYFEAFYLHVVSSFSCIPVICPKIGVNQSQVLKIIMYCLTTIGKRQLQRWEYIIKNDLKQHGMAWDRSCWLMLRPVASSWGNGSNITVP